MDTALQVQNNTNVSQSRAETMRGAEQDFTAGCNERIACEPLSQGITSRRRWKRPADAEVRLQVCKLIYRRGPGGRALDENSFSGQFLAMSLALEKKISGRGSTQWAVRGMGAPTPTAQYSPQCWEEFEVLVRFPYRMRLEKSLARLALVEAGWFAELGLPVPHGERVCHWLAAQGVGRHDTFPSEDIALTDEGTILPTNATWGPWRSTAPPLGLLREEAIQEALLEHYLKDCERNAKKFKAGTRRTYRCGVCRRAGHTIGRCTVVEPSWRIEL